MNKAALLLSVLAFYCGAVFAQNTGLDPSFAKGGILVDSSYAFGYITHLKLQPDGKIIASARSTNGFFVARYKADGTHDNSFGNHGVCWPDSLLRSPTYDVSICGLQPDNKIILTGSAYTAGGFLLRLYPDGRLDSSFGNKGALLFPNEGNYVATIMPDGSIVGASPLNNDAIVVRRFTANGGPDLSFGISGVYNRFLGFPEGIDGISVLASGKIAVELGGNYLRLLANGQADSTFCGTGFCAGFDYGNDFHYASAIIHPDGSILLRGYDSFSGGNSLVRWKPDATPDSTFGPDQDGKFDMLHIGVDAFTEMSDGRIICVWASSLARLQKDGQGVDSSFGNNGIIRTSAGGMYKWDFYAVGVQADGKIVAGGSIATNNSSEYPSIVRYLPDARLRVGSASVKGALKAYPNPAKTQLEVELPTAGLLQLFSGDGRLIREQSCTGPVQRINLVSLPAGAYLLRFQTADNSYHTLFMKE